MVADFEAPLFKISGSAPGECNKNLSEEKISMSI